MTILRSGLLACLGAVTVTAGLATGAVANASAAPSQVQAEQVAGKGKRKRAITAIEWEIKPAGVIIFLDGKKLGEAGEVKLTKTKPGRHTVRLVNGQDETEMDIGIKRGETLKFAFEFDTESESD